MSPLPNVGQIVAKAWENAQVIREERDRCIRIVQSSKLMDARARKWTLMKIRGGKPWHPNPLGIWGTFLKRKRK